MDKILVTRSSLPPMGEYIDEIADMLNKDIKSIYNTFQRIRQKIKKNIKIDD